MRCSSRNSDLHPTFITSTPLHKGNHQGRPSISQWESYLSPIRETAPARKCFSQAAGISFGKQQLFSTLRPSINQAQRNILPLVIASSDSSEDEFSAITFNVHRKRSTNLTKVKKVARKDEKPKSNTGRALKERPTNFLEEISVGVRRSKRNAKVDAIIDEIVKENSQSFSPPDNKQISEDSVDAMVEKVIKGGKTNTTKRTRKNPIRSRAETTAQENNQENLVRKIVNGSQEVDILLVKEQPPSIRPKAKVVKNEIPLPESLKIVSNNLGVRQQVLEDNEPGPVTCNLSDANWKPINGHDGVFVCKQFASHNSATGYIKINARCLFKKKCSCDQIIVVNEGSGFMVANDTKAKITPGDQMMMPNGCEYEIMNTIRGVRKALILSVIEIANI